MSTKLCINCRHSKSLTILCAHPANGVSLLDGEPNPRWSTECRGANGHCTADAIHFESRTEPRSDINILQKIISYYKNFTRRGKQKLAMTHEQIVVFAQDEGFAFADDDQKEYMADFGMLMYLRGRADAGDEEAK